MNNRFHFSVGIDRLRKHEPIDIDPRPAREKGSNVQRLIPDGELYDPVTGLARQSALPVNVSALA